MMKQLLLISSLLFLLPFSIQAANKPAVAIFAGGCFWCMQADYDKVPGVNKTVVGYMGGHLKNPTYRQVSSGRSGHIEVVAVYYDPKKVAYEKLLTVFWKNVDPTDDGGQFCDRGSSYVSAIFYLNPKQKTLAQKSKQTIIDAKHFKRIVTKIRAASTFYPAETYHQQYYKKNPARYKFYRYTCGRDARLKKIWSGVGVK